MKVSPSGPCLLVICGGLSVLAQKEASTTMSSTADSAPFAVGSAKQLFIDGRFVASSRSVQLRMNLPAKLEPVLRPERPWEDKSIGFCASVIEHEGTFKLFYRADSHEKGASVCLATSSDGLTWQRPGIGLYEFGGSKDNNIVFRASAMGACQVGLQDAAGKDIAEFATDACDVLRCNAVAKTVTWKGSSDVSALAGGPVRLRFAMRAAKLFAFQFTGE
jgi:hypothetical protein